MITDTNLKLGLVREQLFGDLAAIFQERGFKFNKQLKAKKKIGNDDEINLSIHINNYHPVKFEVYFSGAVAQKKLLEPLEGLYRSMKTDLGVEGINNYGWSAVFTMGDFVPQLHHEFGAVRRAYSYSIASLADLEEKTGILRELLLQDALPCLHTLTDDDRLRQHLPELIEQFRDEYLNVYTFLVFAFLYDRQHFEERWVQVLETTRVLRQRGDQINVFFGHLAYLRKYLIENFA